MISPIKVAIVGFGNIAAIHIHALACDKRFEVVDICDSNIDKQSLVPSTFTFYTSLKDCLISSKADVFVVATPSPSHYSIAKEIIRSGKSLLLEKPAACTAAEVQELACLAKANMVNLNVAIHAAYALDVKRFIAYKNEHGEKLGTPTSFECEFYDPLIAEGKLIANAESLGGSWMDSGINALSVLDKVIDIAHYYPTRSRLTSLHQSQIRDAQASVFFSHTADHSRHGSIHTSWMAGLNHKSTRIYYAETRHLAVLNHSLEHVAIYNNDNIVFSADCRTEKPRLVNHYIALYDDLYKAYTSGTSNVETCLRLHNILFNSYIKVGE